MQVVARIPKSLIFSEGVIGVKKYLEKVFLSIVMLMLCGMYISYPLIGKFSDRINHENHALTGCDDIVNATFVHKTAVMEEYVDDHIPYKNFWTRVNNYIDYYVFRNFDSDSVLLGKDDWLFYKKDLCIEDYRKIVSNNIEEEQLLIDSIDSFSECCQRNNIEFYIMITPNKETVYGDLKMPKYVKVEGTESRCEILKNQIIEKCDTEVIFPETQLKEYANNGVQVYKKYDTHWNMIGAYVGTEELFKSMGEHLSDLDNMTVVEGDCMSGDLANMVSMGTVFDDDINYYIDEYELEGYQVFENRQEEYLNYFYAEAKEPICDKTIMCIGDSFLEMMEPYVASYYSKSYFFHRANYEDGFISEIQPDIVVVTATERSFPYIYYDLKHMIDNF